MITNSRSSMTFEGKGAPTGITDTRFSYLVPGSTYIDTDNQNRVWVYDGMRWVPQDAMRGKYMIAAPYLDIAPGGIVTTSLGTITVRPGVELMITYYFKGTSLEGQSSLIRSHVQWQTPGGPWTTLMYTQEASVSPTSYAHDPTGSTVGILPAHPTVSRTINLRAYVSVGAGGKGRLDFAAAFITPYVSVNDF